MADRKSSSDIAKDINSFFQSYLSCNDGDTVSGYLQDYFSNAAHIDVYLANNIHYLLNKHQCHMNNVMSTLEQSDDDSEFDDLSDSSDTDMEIDCTSEETHEMEQSDLEKRNIGVS